MRQCNRNDTNKYSSCQYSELYQTSNTATQQSRNCTEMSKQDIALYNIGDYSYCAESYSQHPAENYSAKTDSQRNKQKNPKLYSRNRGRAEGTHCRTRSYEKPSRDEIKEVGRNYEIEGYMRRHGSQGTERRKKQEKWNYHRRSHSSNDSNDYSPRETRNRFQSPTPGSQIETAYRNNKGWASGTSNEMSNKTRSNQLHSVDNDGVIMSDEYPATIQKRYDHPYKQKLSNIPLNNNHATNDIEYKQLHRQSKTLRDKQQTEGKGSLKQVLVNELKNYSTSINNKQDLYYFKNCREANKEKKYDCSNDTVHRNSELLLKNKELQDKLTTTISKTKMLEERNEKLKLRMGVAEDILSGLIHTDAEELSEWVIKELHKIMCILCNQEATTRIDQKTTLGTQQLSPQSSSPMTNKTEIVCEDKNGEIKNSLVDNKLRSEETRNSRANSRDNELKNTDRNKTYYSDQQNSEQTTSARIYPKPRIPKLGLEKNNVARGKWLEGAQTQGDTYH